MRKIKQLTLGMSFFVALLFSTPAKAGHNNGNYVNGDGCLVVWESYTLFGITWSYNETVFCNSDGSAIQL